MEKELVMNPEVYNGLIKESIKPIKNTKHDGYKGIIGKERIEEYEANNFPLEMVIEFFKGTLSGNRKNGCLNNLIGYELNVQLLKYLHFIKCKNIQSEVDIYTHLGKTSLDAVADLDGTQKFKVVLPSMKEVIKYGNLGTNSFEVKAMKKLSPKALLQIQKARTIFPAGNSNVFVCADTKINKDLAKQIDSEGGNIIRSGITKNMLVKNLLNIQKQIRLLH